MTRRFPSPFDKLRVTLGAAALLLAACTTGQANTTPPISPGSPGGGNGPGTNDAALQLSVGTINFAGFATGLNVLETFRDGNGYSALPITTATLRGPAGFAGPKKSQDPGSGKNVIPLGSASDQFDVGAGVPDSIYAAADGYGIGPPSCSCAGVNLYPLQPQFWDVTLKSTFFPQGPEPFYGGPPAYPTPVYAALAISGGLVSVPAEWPEGFYFVSLSKPPPSGTYAIDVSYSQNGASTTKRATASLRSSALLPSMEGQPTAHSDHQGGLIVNVDLPRRVKEVLVNVIDANVPPATPSYGQPCLTGLGFATLRFTKSGTLRIPDNLGNAGQGGAPTFCKGDILSIQLMGFDYDAFALGPPNDAQQRPRLPARADVTYTTNITSE